MSHLGSVRTASLERQLGAEAAWGHAKAALEPGAGDASLETAGSGKGGKETIAQDRESQKQTLSQLAP